MTSRTIIIMSFPKPYFHSKKKKIEVELDLSNYATKSDLQNAAAADISDFARKSDLTSLKSDVDELDIDKLKNVPKGR